MSDPYGRPAVVIDNGTGYTKMGYAGNVEPQYIVPTVAGFKASQVGGERTKRVTLQQSSWRDTDLVLQACSCRVLRLVLSCCLTWALYSAAQCGTSRDFRFDNDTATRGAPKH